MSVDDEPYFPRGGTSKKQSSLKRTPYVFQPKQQVGEKKKKLGRRERKKLKTQKVRKVSDKSDDENEINDSIVEEKVDEPEETREPRLTKIRPLQYRDLVEGFVSLCSVQAVLKSSLRVSLPERLLCTVKWADISFPLVESRKGVSAQPPNLDRFFKIGDILACRVKSASFAGSNFDVLASTDPAELNRETPCENVKIGSVFFGAVKSVEDHGYIIYSGIAGLTAFLPFDSCKGHHKPKKLPVGKLLWCVVTDANIGESTNNVRVSIDGNDLNGIGPAAGGPITPGNKFDLTVTKHLSEKIQVSVVGMDFHGFIPRSHLQSFGINQDYKVGSKLRGSVLYKFPVVNVAAFSLKIEPAGKAGKIIENGTVFEAAEICWHEYRGIGVRFEHRGDTCYGLVSRKRMEGNVESKNLKDQFPLGNHINVVVIGYHHVDQLYSCSTQDEILTGKFLMVKHLKEMVGKLVTVTVVNKNDKGAVVAIENRTAFVPLSQITDSKSSRPLEKLKINDKHPGRILRFDAVKNSILVTLRPTLVSNKPLTDFGKVKQGESYFGSVSSVNERAITLAFFNGLKADISQENLIEDCRKYKVGDLIKCYVIKEKRDHRPPEFSMVRNIDQMTLSIGETYKVIVKNKNAAVIECIVNEGSTVQNVTIPLQYLTDHEELQTKTRDHLVPGSVLDMQLFCYDNFLNPVFTLRDSVRNFFAEGGQRLKSKGFAALKKQSLIPAIVAEELSDGYFVSVPVPLYNGRIFVAKDLFPQSVSTNDFVWLAVKQINLAGKQIILERPSFDTHSEQFKHWAVSNLISYLREVAKFQTYKPNDRVPVVFKEQNQCQLADGRKGIVVDDSPKEMAKGERSTMSVLFESWGENGVIYLANSDVRSDSIDSELKEFDVIYVNKIFFICKSPDGAVCYCPRYLSPYSKKPDFKISTDKVRRSVTIEPIRVEDNLLFGYLSNREKHGEESEQKNVPSQSEVPEIKAKKRKQKKNGEKDNKKLKIEH